MKKAPHIDRARQAADRLGRWGLMDEGQRYAVMLETREVLTHVTNALEGLHKLVWSPHTDDFLKAVRIEEAHQRDRWGDELDREKLPTDWFWLLGWLSGKAVHGPPEKRLHHIITTAAVCLNWHRNETERASGERTTPDPETEPPSRERKWGSDGTTAARSLRTALVEARSRIHSDICSGVRCAQECVQAQKLLEQMSQPQSPGPNQGETGK